MASPRAAVDEQRPAAMAADMTHGDGLEGLGVPFDGHLAQSSNPVPSLPARLAHTQECVIQDVSVHRVWSGILDFRNRAPFVRAQAFRSNRQMTQISVPVKRS